MQPNRPEMTHTTGAATEVSAQQSAPALAIIQDNCLFPNTLPITILDRILCEPKQGCLTPKGNASNTLKNEVPKKIARTSPRTCPATVRHSLQRSALADSRNLIPWSALT